ncbi:hypothetical protein B0J17DRAFT_405385 [Rhizoctonia solani]|nr:hypothetical protein B0J17DRAFT_405385 [Rhizoctonia solani]
MPYSSQAKPGSHHKPTGVNEVNTSLESVRTLASTQYFDDWSGRGAWSIVIANRAVGDLRRIRKGDGHVFRMVSKKIKELSQGFFSDDNQKRLTGLNTEVPIYEAKVSRDLRIVYQIDLDTDVKANVDKQIIKLYGIYTHAQMDNRLWSLVSNYHMTRRGKEYRRRCSFRDTPRALGQNVTLPAKFPHEEGVEVPIEPQVELDKNMKADDLSAVRSLVASEKFILMSKSLVKSIVDDLDGGHIFQVSSKEKEVIYHDSACFVLGRSGTGKTTCIVFKMLGIEKMYDWAEEERPRQVFITQSPELAQRVQEYYRALVETDSQQQTARSNEMVAEDESILADLRDEDVEAFGLPSRYSLLEDKHFPLFLTYDQLCSLLEEDYKFEFGRMARSQASAQRFDPSFRIEIQNESKQNQSYITEKLLPAVLTMEKIKENKHASITFEVFAIAYWPHFDQRLTKDLDPALVYSEFLGVIEGSEFTLTSQSGVLSRSEYLELSDGGSLLSSQRDKIYTLYVNYRKARGQRSGYDAAERTHALIVATQDGKRLPGPKIDAIYVDEAQDNLLIDTKLMRNLSNNPHGILMAGDTAQTISAGSSFRFEDLKAFSWRLENQDETVQNEKRKPIHPTLFHLSVNYRSHGGIVDCASAIVELVSELFPNSIDKLKKETGLIGGPRPTFFSGWEHSSIPIGQFLRDQDNVKVDFGAHQVILVRNEAARNSLRAQVGDIGLILTLYESKGLEFNDVLLYNFFEDSVASDTTWRIVLHGLNSRKYHPLPQFEEVRHAVICSELKNLYVGLTRARNHCWILDVSERAEPMKQIFWTERNLIGQCGPGDPIPQLSASSSKSEWEERGRALFERQLYLQAILCFERAGLPLERDISAAYEARKRARLLQATKPNDRETRTAFRDAADKFLGCSKIAASKQQRSCYLRAADCFVQAEEWKPAAETFILVSDFGMAAKCLRNAGCFTEAVDLIKAHQGDIPENIAEEIKKVARLEYLRTDQFDQAEELFSDLDEQLDYMEDCGLDTGRIHVLEQHQRHEEAAEVAATAAFNEGNIIEGVRLLKSSNDSKLLHQAIDKALGGLWILYPFSRQVDAVDNSAADALIQSLSDEQTKLTEEAKHQLEVFQAIRAGNLSRILSLAQSHGILASGSPHRSILSLLCFPRNSNSMIPTKEWSLQDFINTSKLTWKYISQLFLFARTLDISVPSTQRLLGVEKVEQSISSTEANEDIIVSPGFRIYSTSLLFKYLHQSETPNQDIPTFNHVLNLAFSTANESNTRELALNALYSILRSEIFKVHEAASFDFQALYPCLDFAVFGNCKRPDCRRQQVNTLRASEAERQASFNLRTRALIMQIYIADKYYTSTHPDVSERRKIRRTWAHKIYENLMPLFPPLGGPNCVDGVFIPELDNGAHLISVWCHQVLFELDPRYGAEERFLSDALTFMDLAFRVDGGRFATYVGALHSSRLVKVRRDLMTRKPRSQYDRSFHSIVHDFINFYRRKSDDAIRRVIQATHHVIMNGLTIEVNVLVHLLEFMGREIIVQHRTCNRGKYGVFDGLVVPQSWALDIAKRPPLIVQTGFGLPELMEYLSTLYKTLENLREYGLKASCLYSFSGKAVLNLVGRGILILRICRLIVLVANNTNFTRSMKEDARLNIIHALTGSGEVYRFLCDRLIQNTSWSELEVAIMRCPLNRGTDRLVHLFLRKGYSYPRSSNFIQVIAYSKVPDLIRLLSFTDSVQRPQPTLNAQAQPYNPSHPSQSSPANQTSIPHLENELEPSDGDDADLMRSDPESTHFSAPPESPLYSMRKLTFREIESGRKILFAYRRFALRKQTRQKLAVEKICRCYLRYLRRQNAPRSAADDRYLKFQREYKKDIKMVEGSGPALRSFYRYKAILLGCMPHVAVYLRGLEHANQQQKHANRKRLQIAHHKELEEIQKRMDVCSEFTTGLKKLASAIMPGSKELQDQRFLRKHVKDLEDIYHNMEEEFGRNLMPTFLEHHRQCGAAIILAQSA